MELPHLLLELLNLGLLVSHRVRNLGLDWFFVSVGKAVRSGVQQSPTDLDLS